MKIGFIGCGNMGSALCSAIIASTDVSLYISDTNSKKLGEVCAQLKAEAATSVEIARTCDFIFLAVKPNIVPLVAEEINDFVPSDAAIVSMAAGVSIASLSSYFGEDKKIIRIMPNTPVALGKGVVLYCVSSAVTNGDEAAFTDIMSAVGTLDKISESLIDAASAVSGCGPAFVYMFIEALADGGVACGLPRDKAMLYACETLKGAAEMVLATKKHPGQLKDEVCSPGGSTIEGVHALEDGAFRSTVSDAVIAAYEKTKRLGNK